MDQAVTIAPADESERLARSVDTISLDANSAEPSVCPLKALSIFHISNSVIRVITRSKLYRVITSDWTCIFRIS